MNDNEMISLLFDRSESVISEIEKRYKKQCIRVARNILRNEQDAEECFNDALFKLWNTVPPKEPRSLFAYLSVITRNIALDRYKYLSADIRKETDLVFEEIENCIPSNDNFEENELAEIINEFLRDEESENRKIFLLRYYEATSLSEISKILSLPETSVKMRLSRMKKRLKKSLIKKGVYK
ncbi:MAG: RNA polymerase sigma factor [Clostridia bacterium]|nr:RNA polymerase sigma factor [Clostridia bacterium]